MKAPKNLQQEYKKRRRLHLRLKFQLKALACLNRLAIYVLVLLLVAGSFAFSFPQYKALDERKEILEETKLTASAGISMNKFIAKVASDMNKPNGQTLIHPLKVDEFTANLEIDKFFGIGKKTTEKLHGMGIHTGADLRKYERRELVSLFGKSGRYYYNICRGIDERPVQPNRIRQSGGAERTYSEDIGELEEH